jgi:hypothetical protein
VSNNKYVQKSVERLLTLKKKQSIVSKDFNGEKEKILRKIKTKKFEIEKLMNHAPFVRMVDKCCFLVGTAIMITYSFVKGRYPHDWYYVYWQCLLPALLLTRWIHYYLQGWHFFFSDFCYFANALILYYITFDPKNDQLFKTCFLFAMGALAVSTKAFRNSLVFHKIDMITSLAIHAFPMTLMCHIRYVTIPDQAHLPVD